MSKQSPFLQSIASFMQVRRYSRRTIDSYLHWIKYFILFNGKQHPSQLGDKEIEDFLTHLAVERHVSAATQSIALNAIVFVKRKFLGQEVGDVSAFAKSNRQRKLPAVLTQQEVANLISVTSSQAKLVISLLYGSGLRRIELVRLRVKDIDFGYGQVQVWNGKGNKHRLVTLAKELEQPLKNQIARVKQLLTEDLAVAGYAGVWMPDALARKYPSASKSLAWQFLFPSSRLSYEPGTRYLRRHHRDETNVNKMLRSASRRVGIEKQVGSHTL